jgi:hypothetical protein
LIPPSIFDRKEAASLIVMPICVNRCDEAIADSGMEMEKLDLNKVGVIFFQVLEA